VWARGNDTLGTFYRPSIDWFNKKIFFFNKNRHQKLFLIKKNLFKWKVTGTGRLVCPCLSLLVGEWLRFLCLNGRLWFVLYDDFPFQLINAYINMFLKSRWESCTKIELRINKQIEPPKNLFEFGSRLVLQLILSDELEEVKLK
jgi:hypothetical protein